MQCLNSSCITWHWKSGGHFAWQSGEYFAWKSSEHSAWKSSGYFAWNTKGHFTAPTLWETGFQRGGCMQMCGQ